MVPNIGKIQRSGPARAARPAGILTKQIADYFGIHFPTVGNIVRGGGKGASLDLTPTLCTGKGFFYSLFRRTLELKGSVL